MSSTTGGFEGLDGIQSGIASKKIIEALVNTRQQRVERLAAKQVDLENRVGIYGKINSLVDDLKNVAQTLAMSRTLGHLAAVSSDSDVAEGIVTGSAQHGSYRVDIKSVASASRNYSDKFTSATQKGLLYEGALSIQVGERSPATITIDRDTSLQDVRDQINAAGLGVHAEINHGSGNIYTLVVTGMKQGEAHAVKISETRMGNPDDEDTGQLLNLNNHVASRAQDTVIRVDGQTTEYRSSSETVEGAIAGVSLKVSRGADTKKSVEINLETNPESVKAQLEQFVQAYNRLMRVIYEATKKRPAPPDPKNSMSGQDSEDPDDAYTFHPDGTQSLTDRKVVNPDRYKLTGDKTIERLGQELQRMMNEPLGNIISGPRAPAHVGVVGARDEMGRQRKDGTITIDADKLRNAVLSDYDGVLQVFTADATRGTAGVFGKAKKVLDTFSYNPATKTGALDGSAANMRYEIRRVRKEMESRQDSVDAYRKVLTAQFVELEKFMAKHKSQGDFLNAVASAVNRR